ncbi:MAG: hypothetical protein ACO31F_06000 [Ilumatobacteraceae bacterium]
MARATSVERPVGTEISVDVVTVNSVVVSTVSVAVVAKVGHATTTVH